MKKTMNEKTLRTLVDVGAVNSVRIVAEGSTFHVVADTPNGPVTAETLKGEPKTWGTLDGAAKWVRSLGIGSAQLELSRWQPRQQRMKL